MADLARGTATVVSPATCANLGPGFDAYGLCLALHDRVEASAIKSGLDLDIRGEGESTVSRDESHLVVSSMRATFDLLGIGQPGLRLSCANAVPHGRGLGSSAAAIVAGIRLAEALVQDARLTDAEALGLATGIEGHPDNVAACLSGGFTIAWHGRHGAESLRLQAHSDIRPVLFVPPDSVPTDLARGLLPGTVSHGAASANAGRAGLLVAALTTRPDLLLDASEDRLHQEFRRSAMPSSSALVASLREAGVAAVISGAGPTVLAMTRSTDVALSASWTPRGWRRLDLSVEPQGAVVVR